MAQTRADRDPATVPPTYLDANRLWVDSRLRAAVAVRVEGPVLERLGARGARCVEIGTGRRALGARCALTRLGATEVRAFDLHAATVARARQRTADLGDRLRLQVCDATCLPVETGSVDLVVDLHALHHIEDWRTAVRECARMLRPGGQLALAEMTRRFVDAPWLRAVSRHPADRFDADELLAELRAAGFELGPADVVRRMGDRWVAAVARRV
ncbi:class I SAM-dependent methyltransferase [Modestobacter sp. NPDC049651]|uniref:class I SAM-dependent methyltransferase n=1 Tax=unclassified Modestobacter TaxID=2643866 RepID=UPI0033E55D4E